MDDNRQKRAFPTWDKRRATYARRIDVQQNRWLIFLFLGIGIPFVAAGLLVGLLVPRLSSGQAEQIERLVPSTATVLEDTSPGQEVLVEGRISNSNPVLFRSYVAYIVYGCTVNSDGERKCTERNRVIPPLLLDLPDGQVQIENDAYDWQGTKQIVQEGDTEYAGLEAGDPVIAVGVLTSSVERLRLRAEFISRGTQAEYIAFLRGESVFWRVFGAVFAVLGSCSILAGAVLGVRAWKRR